jgi:hypothetical protein
MLVRPCPALRLRLINRLAATLVLTDDPRTWICGKQQPRLAINLHHGHRCGAYGPLAH